MNSFVRKCNVGVQHGTTQSKTQGTQVVVGTSSYMRTERQSNASFLTYDRLCREVLWNRDMTLAWCQTVGLIAKEMSCPTCKEPMKLVENV